MEHTMDTTSSGRTLNRSFYILTFLVMAADFVFGAVYVQVLLERDFDPAFIGASFFVIFLITSFVEIPSGDWGDRYGQRRVTVFGLLAWGLGLALFGLFDWAPVVVAGLLLWSVGQALYSGAPVSLAVNAIPAGDRDTRARLVRLGNVYKWIGSTAGGLLVLVGAVNIDVETTIAIAGAALLVVALWVRLAWPESERLADDAEPGLIRRARAAWAPALSQLIVLTAAAGAMLSILLFGWQPLVTRVVGLPEWSLGLVLVFLTIAAAGGAALTRFEIRNASRLNWDGWALLGIAGVALAVAPLSNLLAAAGIMVAEVAISATLTLAATRAHARFDDAARNLLWSIFGWTISAAMAVADLAFGVIWQWGGLGIGFAASMGLVAVVAAGALLVLRIRARVAGDRPMTV